MESATTAPSLPGLLVPLRLSWFAADHETGDAIDRWSARGSSRAGAVGAEATLKVRLLGTFRAFDAAGNRVDPAGIPGDVLKLLAVRRTVHLDELVDCIWPGSDLQTGRRRLRNVINRIRSSCGDVVTRDGEMLRLAETASVDAHRFEHDALQALALGPTAEGLALAGTAVAGYHGELLPADRFRDWTAAPRERLRKRFVALLDLLSEAAAERGDVDEVVWLVDRAIELEPYDEHRYVRAARALSEAGRQGAAVTVLGRAKGMLDDLGVSPSPRFQAFEHALRAGGSLPPAREPSRP